VNPENIKPSNILWSKNQWGRIREGGTWAVPRSGLIFKRTKDGFDLLSIMPFLPELADAAKAGRDVPPDAEALWDCQRSDFQCIRKNFREAGLSITDSQQLLTEK
jgi:hypothetical protein